jgi:hypothetical protein
MVDYAGCRIGKTIETNKNQTKKGYDVYDCRMSSIYTDHAVGS